MTVSFEKKEDIEKEFLEQEIEVHCTRATCMSTIRIKKSQYQRLIQEEGAIRCPKCGVKMV